MKRLAALFSALTISACATSPAPNPRISYFPVQRAAMAVPTDLLAGWPRQDLAIGLAVAVENALRVPSGRGMWRVGRLDFSAERTATGGECPAVVASVNVRDTAPYGPLALMLRYCRDGSDWLDDPSWVPVIAGGLPDRQMVQATMPLKSQKQEM